MTELNDSLPEQLEERQERLAKFVLELWAQNRHVVETRRRINKRWPKRRPSSSRELSRLAFQRQETPPGIGYILLALFSLST